MISAKDRETCRLRNVAAEQTKNVNAMLSELTNLIRREDYDGAGWKALDLGVACRNLNETLNKLADKE